MSETAFCCPLLKKTKQPFFMSLDGNSCQEAESAHAQLVSCGQPKTGSDVSPETNGTAVMFLLPELFCTPNGASLTDSISSLDVFFFFFFVAASGIKGNSQETQHRLS